jgi:hypothetical protein
VFRSFSIVLSGVPQVTLSKISRTMPAFVYSVTVPSAAVACRASVSASPDVRAAECSVPST